MSPDYCVYCGGDSMVVQTRRGADALRRRRRCRDCGQRWTTHEVLSQRTEIVRALLAGEAQRLVVGRHPELFED